MIDSNLIGYIAIFTVFLGSGWQTYKVFKTHNTRAITYPFFILVNITLVLWFIYGVSINNPIIYIPNLICPILYSTILLFKYKNEKEKVNKK